MPTADSRTLQRERLAAVALALLTLALYLPVRNYEFNNFDDAQYITQNRRLLAGLSAGNIGWAFTTGYAGNWHPLTWLSHLLDCQVYGLNAGGHHLTSVVIHALNAVLLFALLRRMTNAVWRSAFVAALFAWHPMHVESVAWVAERKDVLSGLFWLLAVWAYVRYARARRDGGKCVPYYWLSLGLFALGLLSKPMVVTLPLVLLLLDYWPLGRASGRRLPLVIEKIPFFLLALASCAVTFVVQRRSGAVASSDVPLWMRCENAVNSYLIYVEKLLWPRDLAVLYPYSFHLPIAHVAIAAVVIAAMTVFVLVRAPRSPHLFVGWFWFLIMLLPVIGLVQVGEQALADRYTYLPSIGFFVMLTWEACERFAARAAGKAVLGAAAALCLAACFAASVVQLRYWRDSETLFRRAVDVTTDNALAHSNLGVALASKGKFAEALAHFKEALRIRPFYHEAQINAEKALVIQGKLEEAAQFDTDLLQAQPDDGSLHNRLALVLAQQGKLDAAIEHYRAALRGNPGDDRALANLGLALARQGKSGEAANCFRRALEIAPGNAYAHYGLGQALDAQDKLGEAAAEYERALASEPDFAEAHNALGAVLAAQGRFDSATQHLSVALQLKPDFAEAHYNFGNALLGRGDAGAAAAHYNEAIRIRPAYFEAQLNLANAFAKQGQWQAAVERYNEALRLRPDFTGAHANIAQALERLGRAGEAAERYRLALNANPQAVVPLKRLAWLLATSPDAKMRDGAEARRLAALATQLAPEDPSAWDSLAAANAESGQFKEAAAAANKALELSAKTSPNLAAEIRKRLALYESGAPFREPHPDESPK